MNFYGDDTRWFVARVINWEDTYRGRVQIRILGLDSENVFSSWFVFCVVVVVVVFL